MSGCAVGRGLLRSESVGHTARPCGRRATVVNRAVIDALWSAGLTPVVNSVVALDKNAEPLNCNADTVAGALAAELRADVLVLLSDVDQLRADARGPGDGSMSLVTGADIEACSVGRRS